MNSLWISVARIVRKACAARAALFDAQSRTCHPQLFPQRREAQVDKRAGFSALPGQLGLLY
jgi:hypothetical protein